LILSSSMKMRRRIRTRLGSNIRLTASEYKLQVSNSGGRTGLGADASGEDVSLASGRRLLVDNVEGRVIGQPTARSV